MVCTKTFIFCYAAFYLSFVKIHGFEIKNNEKIKLQRKLHRDIFNGYNSYIIPISQRDVQPLVVRICMYILAFEEVNLREQTITSRAYVKIEWTDFQLEWLPESYGGTTKIFLPVEKIWKPDIYLLRSFELKIGIDDILAEVNFDGNVTAWGFGIYKMSSSISIQDYPFDTQKCGFEFGMWVHTSQDVIFEVTNKGIDLSFYSESSEWYFKTEETITTDKVYGNVSYQVISFPFTLKRKVLFDIMNTIVPCVLISFLTVLVFKLPTGSGERTGLCTALFLTSAVFFTSIKDSLPVNSEEVSILEIYVTSQMLGNVSAVVLTIISIRIRYKHTEDQVTGKSPDNGYKSSKVEGGQIMGTAFEYDILKSGRKKKCPLIRERKCTSFDSQDFDHICYYTYLVWVIALHLWLLITGVSKVC